MFFQYTTDHFSKLRCQHNIVVLVGNGFDMAVLKHLGCHDTTSYAAFFTYLNSNEMYNSSNTIIRRIKEKKQNDEENWCDFESTIGELLFDCNDYGKLKSDLSEIQALFVSFLMEVVSDDIECRLDGYVSQNENGIRSLSMFLMDIPESEGYLEFQKHTGHYDLFNFQFFNFNYTMLLDSYIYLDKKQFDPHMYKYADTHFSFYPNPCDYNFFVWDSKTKWSSYLLSDVIHPHGVYTIPRSIIFGTDLKDCDNNDPRHEFIKSYWARYETKYAGYFEEAELYIIYGMSITSNDAWWFDKIIDSIHKNNSELIVYYYDEHGEYNRDAVIKKLWKACVRQDDITQEDCEKIENRIHVVILHDNANVFLGM